MRPGVDKQGQTYFVKGRILVWFSCGAASAVAAKLAVDKYRHSESLRVLYCEVANEHSDNARFRADVERWINFPIEGLRSAEYPSMDIYDVFTREKYISGIGGARCTKELKREVREAMQWPEDTHIFGYTADEVKRITRFEKSNPALFCEWILAASGITKEHCYDIIKAAGIQLPAMYLLGFDNNNCIGCVKAQGEKYWGRIRQYFPSDFSKMAAFSRSMGVRLLVIKGQRLFLDELPSLIDETAPEEDIECGPQCITPGDKETTC